MFNKQVYVALPAVEKPPETSVLLLDDDTLFQSSTQRRLSRWVHWLFHGLSLITIFGLALGIHAAAYTSRSKCWDMFNYYCKRNTTVAMRDDEVQLADPLGEPLQLL